MARASRYESYERFPPYVSAAERRALATAAANALTKRGQKLEPVRTSGLAIAKSFWGKAWCDNLERYSDLESRLPRGRTYVRRGAVIDLKVTAGKVTARVSGSELYEIEISIDALPPVRWRALLKECAGKIDSLIELLQGKLSASVMALVTHPEQGLFPELEQIELSCSCPDHASMCKHVAAALYGVGARLDERPELLFLLRGVDHQALIAAAGEGGVTAPRRGRAKKDPRVLEASSLSELFGIEIEAKAGSSARSSGRAAKGARR